MGKSVNIRKRVEIEIDGLATLEFLNDQLQYLRYDLGCPDDATISVNTFGEDPPVVTDFLGNDVMLKTPPGSHTSCIVVEWECEA